MSEEHHSFEEQRYVSEADRAIEDGRVSAIINSQYHVSTSSLTPKPRSDW